MSSNKLLFHILMPREAGMVIHKPHHASPATNAGGNCTLADRLVTVTWSSCGPLRNYSYKFVQNTIRREPVVASNLFSWDSWNSLESHESDTRERETGSRRRDKNVPQVDQVSGLDLLIACPQINYLMYATRSGLLKMRPPKWTL